MRAMMRTRIAVLALAAGMSPALAGPIPVALVEEVSGAIKDSAKTFSKDGE
jgi:hypothetical protein